MKFSLFKKQDNSLLAELRDMKGQWISMEQKLNDLEQQLQKSARLQFKTGKTLEEKMGQLTASYEEQRENTVFSKTNTSIVINKLIHQIDDMDIVSSNLQDDSHWGELLKTWINSLLATLGEFGVYDTVKKGDTFDPALAKAIDTVPVSEHNHPFEVVRIYTRTFTNQKGAIIRKGQVATVRGEL